MLNLPQTTAFGKRIPKQKFYEHLDVTPELKRCFTEQLRLIIWENKLSPQTLNIAPGKTVQEIELFRLRLTGQELDDSVPQQMDQQIPYHLIFLLERPDGTAKLKVHFKEALPGGGFKLRKGYETDWQPRAELSLPCTALDMDALYEAFVRVIAGAELQGSPTESVQQVLERTEQQEKLQKQIDQLKRKMKKEKQLARQMELRRELKKLEEQALCWNT